jgi:hypothetical protein
MVITGDSDDFGDDSPMLATTPIPMSHPATNVLPRTEFMLNGTLTIVAG